MSSYFLGIDLGGSSIKGVALSPARDVLWRGQVEFEANQAMDWAERVRDLARRIAHERGSPPKRIGLSAPGLVARNGRSIAHMPGRLQGLEGLDWTKYLSAAEVVPVLNDAQAALVGEVTLGAAEGCRDVLLLTLGTGVGGAAMVDGHLLRGHIGRAGHLGHICLDMSGPPDITRVPGSLEWMIGNCSIRERSNGRFASTHELIAAYREGDAQATSVWLASVRALACAIASLVNVLDSERVIIGGGIARAADSLFGPLASFLDAIEWRPGGHQVKILPAQLGEFAGAIGAASHAQLALKL